MNRRQFLAGVAATAVVSALPIQPLIQGVLGQWEGMKLVQSGRQLGKSNLTLAYMKAGTKVLERNSVKPVMVNGSPCYVAYLPTPTALLLT